MGSFRWMILSCALRKYWKQGDKTFPIPQKLYDEANNKKCISIKCSIKPNRSWQSQTAKNKWNIYFAEAQNEITLHILIKKFNINCEIYYMFNHKLNLKFPSDFTQHYKFKLIHIIHESLLSLKKGAHIGANIQIVILLKIIGNVCWK